MTRTEELAKPKPRVAGRRGAGIVLLDQLISSASNFLLGVLIARAGGAEALGTFGIAFLVWMAVVGLNRAMVTEPMTVTGSTDSRDAQLPEGLLATLVLGAGVAAVLGLAGLVLLLAGVDATAVLALAACIPGLLAHDYCRSAAFRLQRPDRALISDTGFALGQGAAIVVLFAFGISSTAAFILAWGAGALIGAVLGVVLAGIGLTVHGGLTQLRVLWPRSRWFLAEFSTAFPADQGYLLLLPILLGTSQFGLYRAGFSLIGPVVVVFIAGGNIGLPEAVRRLRENGMAGLTAYAPRLTGAVGAATVLYCGLVSIFAVPLLEFAYGAEFAGAAIVTWLVAGQWIVLAAAFGFGQAVKAAGLMRQLWLTRFISASVSIIAVVLLAGQFGLLGAGLAGLVTGMANSAGVGVVYRRMRRQNLARDAIPLPRDSPDVEDPDVEDTVPLAERPPPASSPKTRSGGARVGQLFSGPRLAGLLARPAVRRRLVVAFWIVAAVAVGLRTWVMLTDAVGPTQTWQAMDRYFIDFRDTVWTPGRFLLAGGNPYDPDTYLVANPWALALSPYAPAWLLLAVALAPLPFLVAVVVFQLLSLAVGIVMLRVICRWAVPTIADLAVPAVLVWLNIWYPGRGSLSVQLGSLLAVLGTALVLRSITASGRSPDTGRPAGRRALDRAVAVGVGIASIKVQFGLTIALVGLVTGRAREVSRGLLGLAALSVPMLVVCTVAAGGPVQFVRSVLRDLEVLSADTFPTGLGYPLQRRFDLLGLLARYGLVDPPLWLELGLPAVALAIVVAVVRITRNPLLVSTVVTTAVLIGFYKGTYDLLLLLIPVLLGVGMLIRGELTGLAERIAWGASVLVVVHLHSISTAVVPGLDMQGADTVNLALVAVALVAALYATLAARSGPRDDGVEPVTAPLMVAAGGRHRVRR